MKFIIIAIVAVVIIGILYTQLGNRKKNELITQNSSGVKTKENRSQREKLPSETLKKINSKEYDRFILTKKTTISYILKMIKEYGSLFKNNNYKTYDFDIAEYGEWNIIKVDQSISFYVFHNLVGWLTGYKDDPDIPEISIGFSKNKTDSQEDYLFFLDPGNRYGDTQIGAFRNGESFSIYLPEAYKEYVNLTIKNNIHVSMKEIVDFIRDKGFNISEITSLKYKEYKIIMNQ